MALPPKEPEMMEVTVLRPPRRRAVELARERAKPISQFARDVHPDQGPWRTVEDVELATLSWVHWYTTERLHGCLDDIPPAEPEEAHYGSTSNHQMKAWNQNTESLHPT